MARTVTLENDVEARLNAEAEKRGTAPEKLANEVLRSALQGQTEPRRNFVVRARDLGARPDVNFDCAWQVLDEIDAPAPK